VSVAQRQRQSVESASSRSSNLRRHTMALSFNGRTPLCLSENGSSILPRVAIGSGSSAWSYPGTANWRVNRSSDRAPFEAAAHPKGCGDQDLSSPPTRGKQTEQGSASVGNGLRPQGQWIVPTAFRHGRLTGLASRRCLESRWNREVWESCSQPSANHAGTSPGGLTSLISSTNGRFDSAPPLPTTGSAKSGD
jgi:hypothetical protein